MRRKDKLQPLGDGDIETVPGQAVGVLEVEQQPTTAAPASECYLEHCTTPVPVSRCLGNAYIINVLD